VLIVQGVYNAQMMSRNVRATVRLNFRRLRRLWSRVPVAGMRGLFHWNYSGELIFFFIGLAIAMIGVGLSTEPYRILFRISYFSLVFAFIWGVGWWLSSEFLQRRKSMDAVSRASYRAWQWIPLLLMCLMFFGSAMLTHQIELSRELSLTHGWLTPANDPDPTKSACENVPKEALRVYLGTSEMYVNGISGDLITVKLKAPASTYHFSIERDPKGRISVSGDVYGSDQKIIATIDHNNFTLGKGILDAERKDESTLRVIDEYKYEVLNIRYLNSHAVRMTGIFRYPGLPLPIQIQEAYTSYGDVTYGNTCFLDKGLVFVDRSH
jgi:hypothetical protein